MYGTFIEREGLLNYLWSSLAPPEELLLLLLAPEVL
jgi:hypothetical protein